MQHDYSQLFRILLSICLNDFFFAAFISTSLTPNYTKEKNLLSIYLFGFLRRFQYCTAHITMGSFMSRGNRYIQLVEVVYHKLWTIGKKLLSFPLRVRGLNSCPQRWEESVLPLHHHGVVNLLFRYIHM